jgi:hypothetical protein
MSLTDVFVLPPKEKIADIMRTHTLDHMDEKIKLSTKLGGQRKNALGVSMEWELALADYVKQMGPQGRIIAVTTGMLKSQFFHDVFAAAQKDDVFSALVAAGLAEKQK